MSADPVSFTVTDGVGRLRLARPDTRNALDLAMVESLKKTVATCAADSSVRSLLVTADGPTFTVGGDVRRFQAHIDDLPEEIQRISPPYHQALLGLARLDVPVVAAVQGAIAGGGLGLAWVADIVIAADNAVFATGFARIGFSGDGGNTWYLPRLVGLRRAQELLIGGRVLNAEEALVWGLVTRVVPLDELEAEADKEARRLADGPTFALGVMRHNLRRSLSSTHEEQLEAEHDGMARCAATAESIEGITSFAERRPPKFGP